MESQLWYTVSWFAKSQTVISHRSTEAEIISLETALRTEALPLLMLWGAMIDMFEPTKVRLRTYLNDGEHDPMTFNSFHTTPTNNTQLNIS